MFCIGKDTDNHIMRKILVVFCILAAIGFVLSACAKPRYQQIETRPALGEFDGGRKAYLKKAAIVPGNGSRHGIDPLMQERYFSAMVESLGKQSFQIELLMPGDAGFPDFAAQWKTGNQEADVSKTARLARTNGFNALMSTSLADIRVHSEKVGFWFWRSTKYKLTIAVTMDILDPFTASKSLSLVEEKTVKSDKETYEAVRAGQWDAPIEMDETLQQLSQAIAKKVAKKMERLPWQAAVISVDDDQVGLAVGKSHGLAIGDWLAVFEGGKVISGNQGQTYIAPGYKVGEIRISDLNQDHSEALIIGDASIQVGDIVVSASK